MATILVVEDDKDKKTLDIGAVDKFLNRLERFPIGMRLDKGSGTTGHAVIIYYMKKSDDGKDYTMWFWDTMDGQRKSVANPTHNNQMKSFNTLLQNGVKNLEGFNGATLYPVELFYYEKNSEGKTPPKSAHTLFEGKEETTFKDYL